MRKKTINMKMFKMAMIKNSSIKKNKKIWRDTIHIKNNSSKTKYRKKIMAMERSNIKKTKKRKKKTHTMRFMFGEMIQMDS